MELLNMLRKPARGHMPVKRTINLAAVGEKKINLLTAVPSIILVVVLSILFSKFAVTDRFNKVAAAQREVEQVRRQVDETLEALQAYSDLTDEYAHYTYTGLTADELTRTDRLQIMDLVERMIMPSMVGGSWSVSANQMVINLQGNTLESINQLVQDLLEEPLVENCTVTTARKTPGSSSTEPVVASVILTFKSGDATVRYKEEEEETKDLASRIEEIEMVNTLSSRTAAVESQGVEE